MSELDCDESWVPKNGCFWTVVLEKTLESYLDCKEIQTVHSKGDQSWVFFGRNDAKAETPVLWPPHAKSWLIGKEEMQVQPLGQEDPLEENTATHSSIFDWRIPWTEEPGGLQSMGSQRVEHNWSNLAQTHRMYWYIYKRFLRSDKIYNRLLVLQGHLGTML